MMNKNHESHVALWTWLSENPSKDKGDYFKENNIPKTERPINWCYACVEAYEITDCGYCAVCPLNWGDGKKCFDDGTLYEEWSRTMDKTRLSELAKKIAEMEWSEE